jgi:hypothetical protein
MCFLEDLRMHNKMKVMLTCCRNICSLFRLLVEPSGHDEERKTKEDLEEVSRGRGTERRKDVEGGEVIGSGQK